MKLELVVFIIGLALFIGYFLFESFREEKLTHDEKKKELINQKSPIFYWSLIFLYWTIVGILMTKL